MVCALRASEERQVDPASFFAASRVVIVAGKGGVGKTVVSAALARAAATSGLDTLLVELDARASVHRSFDTEPLGYAGRDLWRPRGGGRVHGRAIGAPDALAEYLGQHAPSQLVGRLERSGALEVVASTIPGLKDLLLLGKIKHLENHRAHDVIVVDAPASGHALGLLRAPLTFLDLAAAGPLRAQAVEIVELLRDGARATVVLVTLAEDMVVSETIESAFAIEHDLGVALGPVVVNSVLTPLGGLHRPPRGGSPEEHASMVAAARLRANRTANQHAQRERLAADLPLEQLTLPYLFTPSIGAAESMVLGRALMGEIEALVGLGSTP
jgi:Anion-transporting ATPase